MDNKGQVFALFAILLPLILMLVALIIDVGLLYMEKRHVDYIVKDVVEYGMENIDSVTEQELYDLLIKNLGSIEENKIIKNDELITITVSLDKKGVFAFVFGKDKYEIKSTYKGMIEQDSIRIVRG